MTEKLVVFFSNFFQLFYCCPIKIWENVLIIHYYIVLLSGIFLTNTSVIFMFDIFFNLYWKVLFKLRKYNQINLLCAIYPKVHYLPWKPVFHVNLYLIYTVHALLLFSPFFYQKSSCDPKTQKWNMNGITEMSCNK